MRWSLHIPASAYGHPCYYTVKQPGAKIMVHAAHSLHTAERQPHSMAFAACSTPQEGESLILAALRVLYEPNAARKGELTHITARMWRQGHLSLLPAEGDPPVLDRPARDDTVCASRTSCAQHRWSLTFARAPCVQLGGSDEA